MRRFVPLALVASLVATPALAGTTRSAPRAAPDRKVCSASDTRQVCATYQELVLKDVARRASAAGTPISVNDLGRMQLDALIASIG